MYFPIYFDLTQSWGFLKMRVVLLYFYCLQYDALLQIDVKCNLYD